MDLCQPESGGGATSSVEYASVHNPNDVTTSESDTPLEPIREDHPRQLESGGGATSTVEYASGHQPNGVTTSESDHTLAPVIESCVNDQRRIVDNHASGEVRLDNHCRRHPHQTEDAQSNSTGPNCQNVDGQNWRPLLPRPQPSGQNSSVYPSTHGTESYHDSESLVSDLDNVMRPERERFTDWLDSTTQKSDITIPDFLLSENRIYQTDESSKGLVAIINNFTIASDLHDSRGAMVDEDVVRKLFTAGPFADAYALLDTARDLSADQFKLYLDELVTRLKTGSYHSFMLFIMSRGDENGVYTYDEHAVSTEEITAKFDNVLLGQPRIFFITGSQGGHKQMIEGGKMKLNRKPTEFNLERRRELVESNHSITPRGCDMLLAFASVTGYVAWTTREQGTWYITTLVDVISQTSNPRLFSMDIEEILTVVNGQLSDKKSQNPGREAERRQMPYYRSTLRKKFYLLPNPVLPDRP